jgi:hypothetical protein
MSKTQIVAVHDVKCCVDPEEVMSQAGRVDAGGYGLLEWPALLRRLNRLNPGYAE